MTEWGRMGLQEKLGSVIWVEYKSANWRRVRPKAALSRAHSPRRSRGLVAKGGLKTARYALVNRLVKLKGSSAPSGALYHWGIFTGGGARLAPG